MKDTMLALLCLVCSLLALGVILTAPRVRARLQQSCVERHVPIVDTATDTVRCLKWVPR